MPIVGESVWSFWAYNTGSNLYSASWDFRFSPTAGLVKVFLSLKSEFGDEGRALPYIQAIRKRLSDGTDQQIDFHDPWNFNDYIQAYFDNKLSGFIVGMLLRHCWANVMIVLEDWR